MLYHFQYSDEQLLEKLNKISESFLIIGDNQLNKISHNLNFVNVDQLYPLNFEHLLCTGDYLQKKVKYFKLADMVKYAVSRDDIIGSRANTITHNTLPDRNIYFNSYFKTNNTIEISGNNNRIYTDQNTDLFVNNIEFSGLLQKHCPKMFILLLGAKILSSSFFFNEFIEVFGYSFEYAITNNRYFNNFQEFKQFTTAISYSDFFTTLNQQESYIDAIHYLKTKLMIVDIESIPYIVLQSDRIFCETAKILHKRDNQNCNSYFFEELNIKYTEPFERIIKLDGEKSELYQTGYDFYMQHILKLKRKSINALIIKNLYGYIIHQHPINQGLIFNKEASEIFANNVKNCSEISGEKIFHKNCLLFIAMSNYEINRIKTYARSKELKKIFVANFKSFEIQEFNLRKSKNKNVVIVKY
jgi:hypothetical protein